MLFITRFIGKHLKKVKRMTFEYLMAHYLLNGELDKFIENLHYLDDFGYERISRHCQEGIGAEVRTYVFLLLYFWYPGSPAMKINEPGTLS